MLTVFGFCDTACVTRFAYRKRKNSEKPCLEINAYTPPLQPPLQSWREALACSKIRAYLPFGFWREAS